MSTVTLYRPVVPTELGLIEQADFRAFPPRLPDQPIFYPVCNERYAREIAERWNARDGKQAVVTRFDVSAPFLERCETHVVGARYHEEYWIPAEDLDAFNDAIVGRIEIIAEYAPESA